MAHAELIIQWFLSTGVKSSRAFRTLTKNAEIITKLKTLNLRKGETMTCCPDFRYAFS